MTATGLNKGGRGIELGRRQDEGQLLHWGPTRFRSTRLAASVVAVRESGKSFGIWDNDWLTVGPVDILVTNAREAR